MRWVGFSASVTSIVLLYCFNDKMRDKGWWMGLQKSQILRYVFIGQPPNQPVPTEETVSLPRKQCPKMKLSFRHLNLCRQFLSTEIFNRVSAPYNGRQLYLF